MIDWEEEEVAELDLQWDENTEHSEDGSDGEMDDEEGEWLCPDCMENPCECAAMNRYIREQVDKSDRDDGHRS